MCLKPKLRPNLSIKTKSGVRRVFSLSLFTAGFAGLLTHLKIDVFRWLALHAEF